MEIDTLLCKISALVSLLSSLEKKVGVCLISSMAFHNNRKINHGPFMGKQI